MNRVRQAHLEAAGARLCNGAQGGGISQRVLALLQTWVQPVNARSNGAGTQAESWVLPRAAGMSAAA